MYMAEILYGILIYKNVADHPLDGVNSRWKGFVSILLYISGSSGIIGCLLVYSNKRYRFSANDVDWYRDVAAWSCGVTER